MNPVTAKTRKAPEAKREAYFGLPAEVKFCKRCVISNQRPNSCVEYYHTAESKKETIRIDEEGVCDACRFAEVKRGVIDWKQRERELKELCDQYRRHDGSYDCIVPGSGGKDSARASHVLKYKYGMHPLTITWAPHLYTEIGWKNFQNWIHVGGCDNNLFTPNGKVHRLLTRLAVQNLLNPFQPFMIGQKTLAPHMALRHKVPLVFFGENEAEYGNPISDNRSPLRAKNYFTKASRDKIHLGGVSLTELIEKHKVEPADLQAYLPADDAQLEEQGVKVHYLGYYIKWIPQESYYYAVEHTGFEANPERTEGTYSKYNSLDDRIDGFHYWTTYVKYGIGRATYDAAQEIRSGHIDREEGVALVKRFDGEFPKKYYKEILEYLGMNEKEFHETVDKFRSPHLWERHGGEWKLRHRVE